MSVLRVVVIGICITAMAAADFIVENPPGSGPPNSTTTATFHDIDDVCCAAVKGRDEGQGPEPSGLFYCQGLYRRVDSQRGHLLWRNMQPDLHDAADEGL